MVSPLLPTVHTTPRVSFTSQALAWVMHQRPSVECVLRIDLHRTGCAGFEHRLTWNAPGEATDGAWRAMAGPPGLSVHCPLEQSARLDGLEVAVERQGLNHVLVWRNPNAVAGCGCGESWTFDRDVD